MKKSEWIDSAAKRAGMSKKEMTRAYNALEDRLHEALINGEEVQISGFGTFVVRQKPSRMGRNPKTNETIEIHPSKHVVFLPGKKIKEKINET